MTSDEQAVSTDSAVREPPRTSRFTAGLPAALPAALACLGCKDVTTSHDTWSCRLPGLRSRAMIELTPAWLSIGRPMRISRKPSVAQSLLSRNSRLDDGARLAIEDGRGRLLIECPADVIPWEQEDALAALLTTLLTSLGAAPLVTTVQPAVAPSREALDALFTEAGWPLCSAEGGPLEVPLEVPGHYLTATVTAGPTGIGLHLPLLASNVAAAPAPCRAAVMQLVWLAVGGVRWVRPSLNRGQLLIAVHVPGSLAQASTLAHACAALSVAVTECIEEASVLLDDEALALLYLSQSDFKKVS